MSVNDERPMVYNVSRYADGYEYIVAREEDGKLWYWGAYDSVNKASVTANSIGGVVLDKWEKAN